MIQGPSGSGKSDLALRLIDRGALLICDDYTHVSARGNELIASAAPNIAGKIEVRGVGVVELAHVENLPVALVVSLDSHVERMPAEKDTTTISGISLPQMVLSGLEPSAPIKVELGLKNALAGRSQ